MGMLDNVFVKKAMKSMLSKEQFAAIDKFTNALQNGEIDKNLLIRVSDKVSKMPTNKINELLELIEKNI